MYVETKSTIKRFVFFLLKLEYLAFIKNILFDHLHPYIDIVFNFFFKIDFFMSLFSFFQIVCFFFKLKFNINQGFFRDKLNRLLRNALEIIDRS